MGKTFTTVRASIRFAVHVLLLVNPEGAPVGKTLITFVALIWFVPRVDVLVLFHKLEIVKPFVTGPASELIVTSVFAFVVPKTLNCGKTLATLVTNETTLAIVSSLVDIFKMSGGK